MADFDVPLESIYVFQLDHASVFKHYFELNELFEELGEYYDADSYRFEVPDHDWDDVDATLREYHYDPVAVDDIAEFVVVKEQYTTHADILRNSVVHWSRRGYNFFLMKDPLSVEHAVREQGATPAAETDLAVGL